MKILSKQDSSGSAMKVKQGGFTLLELMIVVVIIGILLKVAIPAYTASVQKSNRTDAKTALLDLATREEKYYSVANAYTGLASNLYSAASTFPLNVQSGSTSYYTISLLAGNPVAATSTTPASFTAQAVPVAGTTQANDPCGTFTITNTGVTGNTGGTQTTGCW